MPTPIAEGTGFVDGAVVLWNGEPLATRVESAARVTADVPATLLGRARAAGTVVQNASPLGGASNVLAFHVTARDAPTVTPEPTLTPTTPPPPVTGTPPTATPDATSTAVAAASPSATRPGQATVAPQPKRLYPPRVAVPGLR